MGDRSGGWFNSRCRENLSQYINSHPCQLSLAIPPWVGAVSTSQRAVMLCGWRVKAGMVSEWVAGKTLAITCHIWAYLPMGSSDNSVQLLYFTYFTENVNKTFLSRTTHWHCKSHITGFPSVPKYVTLSDLERPSGRHYALFHTIRQLSEPTTSNSLKLDPYCQRHSPRSY